jgi:NADP-dependent 3-hydroxy acid dehydrogenase YdfG
LAAQCPGHPLKVLALSIDTTDATEQVEAVFSRVEFIINNAGYMEQFRLIADTDPEEWWKSWMVNILGMYHVTRTFLPLLVKCGGKKTVINMTSIGTHFLGLQVSVYQVQVRQYSCRSVPPIC